jgi:hypothetical protein
LFNKLSYSRDLSLNGGFFNEGKEIIASKMQQIYANTYSNFSFNYCHHIIMLYHYTTWKECLKQFWRKFIYLFKKSILLIYLFIHEGPWITYESDCENFIWIVFWLPWPSFLNCVHVI